MALAVAAGQKPQNIHRFTGVVTAVGEHDFTLNTQGDGQVTLYVTENTRFRGVSGLSDLKPGMKALAVARQDEGGRWVALAVGARQDEGHGGGHPGGRDARRLVGQVASVSGNALTVTTRDGQSVTVKVTGETRFRGVSGLSDLQEGQAVLVVLKETGGEPHALLIAARKR